MSQKITTRRAGTSGATADTAEQGRGTNIALWVLQVLVAAVFVMGAVPKLTSDPRTVAGFDAIGFGDWFRYLVGALEIAGAVALLIPLLSGLAALAFVGLMIGAVVTTLLVFDGEMVALPAALLVLVAIIAWARRRRTAPLIGLLSSRGRVGARTA